MQPYLQALALSNKSLIFFGPTPT